MRRENIAEKMEDVKDAGTAGLDFETWELHPRFRRDRFPVRTPWHSTSQASDPVRWRCAARLAGVRPAIPKIDFATAAAAGGGRIT